MTIELLPDKEFRKQLPLNDPTYGICNVQVEEEDYLFVNEDINKYKKPIIADVNDSLDHIRKVKAYTIPAQNTYTGDLLRKVIFMMNQNFNYNIARLNEIIYCEYHIGDFYKMHMDIGSGQNSHRKISLSWTLNPNEFNGGKLLFYDPYSKNDCVNYPVDELTILGFTPFTYHEVTPVTTGIRKSIVAWAEGTVWR